MSIPSTIGDLIARQMAEQYYDQMEAICIESVAYEEETDLWMKKYAELQRKYIDLQTKHLDLQDDYIKLLGERL